MPAAVSGDPAGQDEALADALPVNEDSELQPSHYVVERGFPKRTRFGMAMQGLDQSAVRMLVERVSATWSVSEPRVRP